MSNYYYWTVSCARFTLFRKSPLGTSYEILIRRWTFSLMMNLYQIKYIIRFEILNILSFQLFFMKKHVIFKKHIELDWKILKITYKQVIFFNCWQMILNNKLFSLFSFRNLNIFCCFSLGDVTLGWYCWVTEERDQEYFLERWWNSCDKLWNKTCIPYHWQCKCNYRKDFGFYD